MIPLVAVGVFLDGLTVYFADGIISCVFHTDSTGRWAAARPLR